MPSCCNIGKSTSDFSVTAYLHVFIQQLLYYFVGKGYDLVLTDSTILRELKLFC